MSAPLGRSTHKPASAIGGTRKRPEVDRAEHKVDFRRALLRGRPQDARRARLSNKSLADRAQPEVHQTLTGACGANSLLGLFVNQPERVRCQKLV